MTPLHELIRRLPPGVEFLVVVCGAFGMPIIFWGIDMAFKMTALWQSVLLMAGTLFIAGAIVGAIHGSFLVRLADQEKK